LSLEEAHGEEGFLKKPLEELPQGESSRSPRKALEGRESLSKTTK
jgi:hypothetical protein